MFRSWMHSVLKTVLVVATVMLAACGGGGSSDETAATGEVLVGITDAEGDFLRYEVEVVSLQLVRTDGTVIEALPASEVPVDFASLVDLTEFLTAATVPNGVYRQVSLTIDYTNADIVVEVAGEGVSAEAVDSDGQPLGRLQVSVELSNDRPLVVAPGLPALLTLDFDLLATNRVDTSVAPPLVAVQPLLIAEVSPETPKTHRLRGPLLSVNREAQSFILAVRPHRRLIRDFGRLEVATNAETAFEVNGETATGSDGLALLASQSAGTAVIAMGELSVATRRFLALEVYAGESVPGGTLDGVTGTIVARSGDLLTIRGATLDRGSDNRLLRLDLLLQLTTETLVTRQGQGRGQRLTSDALSVGQRITALGSYDAANQSFAADHVRMLLTRITGQVADLVPPAAGSDGELALTLEIMDGRPVEVFDFTGTGADPATDADPAFYQIDTAHMSLASLALGDAVRVFGFISPFGSAPADFQAVSIADASEAAAQLRVRWEPPSAEALTVAEDLDNLSLDASGAPRWHHVFQTGIPLELPADTPLGIIPDPAEGIFALCVAGRTQVFYDFATFAETLRIRLEAGESVSAVTANGDYDLATTTFTARRLSIACGSSNLL